jgi:hypothetical protein
MKTYKTSIAGQRWMLSRWQICPDDDNPEISQAEFSQLKPLPDVFTEFSNRARQIKNSHRRCFWAN